MSVTVRPNVVSIALAANGEVDRVALSPTWRIALRSSAQLLAVEVLRALAEPQRPVMSGNPFSDSGLLLEASPVEAIVAAWDAMAAGLDAPEIRYASPAGEISLAAQGGALTSLHLDEHWVQRASDTTIGLLLADCLRRVAVTV
jgi:hypothetical protein